MLQSLNWVNIIYYNIPLSPNNGDSGLVADRNTSSSILGNPPCRLTRLFASRIHLFWLDQIMKLVASNTLYMYPRNISKKLRLSAWAWFGCGCAHIFPSSWRPRFLFRISFPKLAWGNGNFKKLWGYRSFISDF